MSDVNKFDLCNAARECQKWGNKGLQFVEKKSNVTIH